MKSLNYFSGSFLLFPAVLVLPVSGIAKKDKKPNILFIAIDDLRPELACYGAAHIKSPNIDNLAQQGTVFEKTFCNVPVSGASRASVLTGVRPTFARFKTFNDWADKSVPNHLSLPRYLKESGYTTISVGKVYHHQTDDLAGWTEEPIWAKTDGLKQDFISPESKEIIKYLSKDGKESNGPAFEMADCHDTAYIDGKTTLIAVDKLKQLKDGGKPFFLGVGYLKPHLPFNAPKKYWDMYDHNAIELANNPYHPQNMPKGFIHNSPELRTQYSGVPPDNPLPDDYSRMLRHGYYACVSYIDAQIGILIEALNELELADNTIIVLWGDHGYNLGEHSIWCKHTNLEVSLKSPLIIKAPWSKGNKTQNLVEFVDIYPTIVDLVGLEIPEHCEGKSIVTLMKNPDVKWQNEVFAWWRNGLTIRTQQYQYTEWMNEKTLERQARMLFDHRVDPEENVNVAEALAYKQVADSLSARIRQWWNEYPNK